MNKPKQIGTAAETAVVRVFQRRGWPDAKRHALHGSADIGDLNVSTKFVVEVKGGVAAKDASDAVIEAWLLETEQERKNAGAQFGVLVVQRRGVGPANAERWWAYLTLDVLSSLAQPSAEGYPAYALGSALANAPVRMLLRDALDLLRAAGY